MTYDQSKANNLLEQIQKYYENLKLNKQYSVVDIILPVIIEESNKYIILKYKDSRKATEVWKKMAQTYIRNSIAENKSKLLELLNDEIKFQNYMWNKRWNEYESQ